jgi:hypothetical protein
MVGRTVALVVCPLFLAGCQSFTACTYEERSVSASGAVIEDGVEFVGADVVVDAHRGSLEWKSLDLTVKGTINGHLTSIALILSGDQAAAPLSIPVNSPYAPLISKGFLMQRPGEVTPDLGGVYETVAANLGVLEFATDLPTRPRVSVPLAVTAKRDWFRPHNCF